MISELVRSTYNSHRDKTSTHTGILKAEGRKLGDQGRNDTVRL